MQAYVGLRRGRDSTGWQSVPAIVVCCRLHGGCSSARLERQVVILDVGGSSPLSHPTVNGGPPSVEAGPPAHSGCTEQHPNTKYHRHLMRL